MNGEKTPCMPSLVPVVQLAQPGKLFGRIVEIKGAVNPSRINRDRTGRRPPLARGLIRLKVAPSKPMITVFIFNARLQRKDSKARGRKPTRKTSLRRPIRQAGHLRDLPWPPAITSAL